MAIGTSGRPTFLGGARRTGYEDERSIGEIVGDLTSHSQELIRGEIAIAKSELVDNARQVGGAAAIGIAAWPFTLAAVVLLGFAVATGLGEAIPLWLGFLITAVLYGAIAAVLALTAKARMKDAKLAPTDSIESAKEDLTWIRTHRG